MHGTGKPRNLLWIPVTVAALLNGGILLGILSWNPDYLHDKTFLSNPDAQQYLILSLNMIERGAYSRCPHEPYAPDVLRTPLFPLIIGVAYKTGGLLGVHLASVLCHMASCALLYVLAAKALGPGAGLTSSLFLATDAMTASCSFSGMSESAFLVPLLASLVVFCAALTNDGPPGSEWRQVAAAGLLLGAATMIRPTSLYMGAIYAAMLIVRHHKAPYRRFGIALAALAIVSSAALVAPWIARNWVVAGVPKVTTVDTNNLVYFVGAAGYQQQFGMSLTEAQERIRSEFDLPSYSEAQNPWISDLSPAAIEVRLREAAPAILGKYPVSIAVGCTKGVLKATASHSTLFLGELLATPWKAPGFASLARLDKSAWRTLFDNSPLLVANFAWQMFHVGLALVAAAAGLVAIKTFGAPSQVVALFGAVLAYLYATVGMFGLDAFYRCRIPAVPMLYVFSGAGAVCVLGRLGKRRAWL